MKAWFTVTCRHGKRAKSAVLRERRGWKRRGFATKILRRRRRGMTGKMGLAVHCLQIHR